MNILVQTFENRRATAYNSVKTFQNFEHFAEWLEQQAQRPARAKDHTLIAGCHFAPDGRTKSDIVGFPTALFFDVDDSDLSIDQIAESLKDVQAAIHTTYSHRDLPGERCYRVIITLEQAPRTIQQWTATRELVGSAMAALGIEVDAATNDPTRCYYVPGRPDADVELRFTTGDALPLAEAPEPMSRAEDLAPETALSVGDRLDLHRVYRKLREPLHGDQHTQRTRDDRKRAIRGIEALLTGESWADASGGDTNETERALLDQLGFYASRKDMRAVLTSCRKVAAACEATSAMADTVYTPERLADGFERARSRHAERAADREARKRASATAVARAQRI